MMLSRIANNLYWIGRYNERIGQLARYVSAQYLSSSDLPPSLSKQVVLESLLLMAQSEEEFQQRQSSMNDHEVVTFLTVDEKHPYSIKNYVGMLRENARAVRSNISTDVWEAANRFYHTTQAFSTDQLSKKGPYDFCKHCIDNSSILKGVVDNTLLRNYEWSLIYTGMHLERALQIVQMLLVKLDDIKKVPGKKRNPAIDNYHWTTLLRSAGGLDMSRNYYQGMPPTRKLVSDFFILNRKFPKSILYNLEKLKYHIKTISDGKHTGPDSVEFRMGKLAAHIQYLTVEEISQNDEFLPTLQQELYTLGSELERQYFTF